MRSLLRYAFLKSARDKSLWAFLAVPTVFIGAPIIGIAVEAASRGQRAHPASLSQTSLDQSEIAYALAVAVITCANVGAAAFWAFRSDLANRSLAFMLLALPRTIAAPAAAALFAWLVGAASFVPAMLTVTAAVGQLSSTWISAALVFAIAGTAAAGIGVAMAPRSPTAGTVMLVAFLGLGAGIAVANSLQGSALMTTATAVASAALLAAVAAHGMETRCAA